MLKASKEAAHTAYQLAHDIAPMVQAALEFEEEREMDNSAYLEDGQSLDYLEFEPQAGVGLEDR